MAVTRKVTPDQESLHEMDTQAVAEIVVQEIGIFLKYLNIYRNTIGDLAKEAAERRAETMSMTLDIFTRSNTQNLGRTTFDGTKFLLNNFMTLGRDSMDMWLKSIVLSHRVMQRCVGEQASVIRDYVREGAGFSPLEESVREAMSPPASINYEGTVAVDLRLSERSLIDEPSAEIRVSPATTYGLCVQFTTGAASALGGVTKPVSVSGGQAKSIVPFLLRVDFGFIETMPAERAIEVPVSGVSAVERFDFEVPSLGDSEREEVWVMTVAVYQHEILYSVCSLRVAVDEPRPEGLAR